MNDNNFNVLFERIGRIEATQSGIYKLLERIEEQSKKSEERLLHVESQTSKLMTMSSLCACFITLVISIFFQFYKT